MPQRNIGTTNAGVYAPLNELIDTSASYSLEYTRTQTFPIYGTTKISNYTQSAGQFIFNLEVRSNDGAWGSANITFPYSLASSGTSFVGGTNQVYSFGYPYIAIGATPTYPRTFFGWARDDTGAIVSFTQSLTIYPGSLIMTDGYKLRAIFS